MESKLKSLLILAFVAFLSCARSNKEVILFHDDFRGLGRGALSTHVGAHTEYHYLPEAAPEGNWAVSNDRITR